jgi:selenocysteine-specific elongation factor
LEQLIIGTAGHVDHGKTVLIKALTGVDTDRLQEEKERGISIDLGFAPFRLPGGRLAGVVDVPGHERFIHNMLAGAAGMDLVMLVVDASEGVMPQTREHLAILELLGLQNGIVVITKIDLVEEEWQELVQEEIREELKGTFLEQAPIRAVSALQNQGIDELKILIEEMTTGLETRNAAGPLRLPVDRSFIIAGFGTVVTGTLIQGSVKTGDTVAVVPPGVEARVRNIQVHDNDVREACAGTRVALNLSGLEKDQVLRGSVVSTPGYYRQTDLIDASVTLLASAPRRIKNLDPVHFFLGTSRSVAKLLLLDRDELKPGESAPVQCRLDRPLVAERGDPFVIRSYSPMTTIGGGRILDPYPNRHRRYRQEVVERLDELKQAPSAGGDSAFIRSKLLEMISAGTEALAKETRLAPARVNDVLSELIEAGIVNKLGDSYVVATVLHKCEADLLAALEDHHRQKPLSPGIPRARLKGYLPTEFGQRDYDSLLENLQSAKKILVSNNFVTLFNFEAQPSPAEQKQLDSLLKIYRDSFLQPPSVKDVLEKTKVPLTRKDEYYNFLQNAGLLVKVSEELYFSREAYQEALDMLRRHFASHEKMTLAEFRDITGSSRKFVQALLEHFDQAKYTRRIEDHRVPFKLKP